MRNEVTAASRRPNHKHTRRPLSRKDQGSLRPTLKWVALVCILGSAGYLLFTWNSTDSQPVKARQTEQTRSAPVPQTALHDAAASEETVDETPAPTATVATSPSIDVELLSDLPAVMEKATENQTETAQKLLAFSNSGDLASIREIPHQDLLSLAQLLVQELGADSVAAALESQLGLPASAYLSYSNPAEAIADLVEAMRADTDPVDTRPVLFTDRVETDGTITGNVHVIPVGTKRVYAAFENQGALQGLERVLAVWRNPADDRMVFTEFESVRPGSTYNYVWLELKDGWPAGFYKLDLFHPQHTTELLASRSFNVR